MKVEPVDFPLLESTLLLDAMCFYNAKKANERAVAYLGDIQESETKWFEKDEAWKKGNEKSILSQKQFENLERIAIQLENSDYEIGQSYSRQLMEIATVILFTCATLEAYINNLAKEKLGKHEYDVFDKLSLEGKWLFFPKYIGAQTFNISKKPYQDFESIIAKRNKLVHYKKSKETWIPGKVPLFLNQLGLTLDDSNNAIEMVIAMISSISNALSIDVPFWINKDIKDMNFFSIVFED
jgi:hypothetical protein